jgi:hypothetical protein
MEFCKVTSFRVPYEVLTDWTPLTRKQRETLQDQEEAFWKSNTLPKVLESAREGDRYRALSQR